MKTPLIKHLLASASAVLLATSSQGATINWGQPLQITNSPTDVSTLGTLHAALGGVRTGGVPFVVNGVSFANARVLGGTTGSLTDGNLRDDFIGGRIPTALEDNYEILLQYPTRLTSGTSIVTMSGLTSGRKYAVQVWASDNTGATVNGEAIILDSVTSGQRALSKETTEGGAGQYAFGTFIADAETQTFTARAYSNMLTTPTAAANTILNALQVRDITDVTIPVSAGLSTVAASPSGVPADGTTTSTVTVTLIDSFGFPAPGKQVTLAGSPGGATITPAGALTTNASGQATFTVSSTTAGPVVFTATNTTDSQGVTQTASVTFQSAPSATLSTVEASRSTVIADGLVPSAITVTIRDAGGLPMIGKSVTLAQTLGTGAAITPNTAQTTNASGQVVFNVRSSTPGAAQFTATNVTDSMVVTQTASVTFVVPDSPAVIVYEPFAYTPVNDEINGRLDGKNGGTGWGGAWLDSPNSVPTDDYAFVYHNRGNPADLYGGAFGGGQPSWDGLVDNVPTYGGYAGLSDWCDQSTANQGRLNSHRVLAQSAGAMAGPDRVLWMSMVVRFPVLAFAGRPGLALTDGGYFNDRTQGFNTGNGIGVGNGFIWPTKDLNAVVWNQGNGTSVAGARTEVRDLNGSLDSIIVVKLVFGETDTVTTWGFKENETISESLFNTNALSATAAIDENTLTTLAFGMYTASNAVDEIRIGNTFADVTTNAPPSGPVDIAVSTVAASSSVVSADGTTTSTITVTLKDSTGIPVAGKQVTLAGSPGSAVINPATPVTTDATGKATFTVSSTTLGSVVLTATDVTDSLVVTQTASVNFVDASIPRRFNINFVQFTPSLASLEDPAALAGPGGGLGDTWNQYRAVSGSNLLAADGTATSVAVTTTFTECRTRSTGGLVLLKHGLTDFNKSLSRTVTISGLIPGRVYNVWLASTSNLGGTESAKGNFSASNPTSTVGPQPIDQTVTANITTWEQGNNYALFENVVVNESGQIVISAASAVDHRLPLNGIQLVPVGKARIVTFGIPGYPGVIDQIAKTISLSVPFETNLATLAPTFTLTSGSCNQTSGAPPSLTFASQNPATYTVTDSTTVPPTVNSYSVTVTKLPALGTLVINLGTSPAGTTIAGSTFGTYSAAPGFPTNLPLQGFPAGSILRSVAIDAKLEASDAANFASDLTLLLDPTPGNPGGDFSVVICNEDQDFGGQVQLLWPESADSDVLGTPVVDTKTATAWAAAGNIDLATTGLFLGNAFGETPAGGTWSGTITLTYDIVSPGTPYQNWATGNEPFNGDANGDGVTDGIAFLLGAPTVGSNAISLLPSAKNDGSGLVLEFNMRNAANRGDAKLRVQWSTDLATWTAENTVLVPEVDGTDKGVIFDITAGNPLNGVKVTIPSSKAAGGKLFGRVVGAEN